MNEFEVIMVQDDLAKRGIQYYTMRPGNDCVWVSYGLMDAYYIFRNGQIVDVQID
jgi:hypothetical protein